MQYSIYLDAGEFKQLMMNICWTKGPIVQSQLAEKARLVNAIWLVKKQLIRPMSIFNKYSVTTLLHKMIR